MKFRLFQGKEGFWLLLLLAAAWTLVSCGFEWTSRYLFPTPASIGGAFAASWPELLRGTLSSFLVLAPAYLLAAATGIAAGISAGCFGALDRMLRPFSRFASPIPPNVYIPYAIALLPTFGLAAGFVIFAAAFWPVFLNSLAGVHALPERYRDNARIIGIGRVEFLWRIALPASLPHIFSGLAVGLALSFIMLTVAELFGATHGLGRFVQFYADYSDYPRMVAGILYTGAVVFLAMGALELLKRRLLFWVNAD